MPSLDLRLGKDMLVVAPLITAQLLDLDSEEQDCIEYLNVLDDELVGETHRRFKIAGAQCTPTNTCRANRTGLERQGLERALVDLNREGVRLARKAGFEHVLATLEVAPKEILLEQATALLAEAPDALLLVGEDGLVLTQALVQLRALTELPLIASAAVLEEKSSSKGVPDVISLTGLSLEESLAALPSLAERFPGSLMVCPEPPQPTARIARQRSRELERAADEMVDFALEARARGAELIGTAPGSSPVFTGALFAAISGMEVA